MAYEAMQVIAEAEQQAASTSVAIPAATPSTAAADVVMEVDSTPAAVEGGTKRKAEEEIEAEGSKKPRTGK